jgi:PAS domain S-box-containing protein
MRESGEPIEKEGTEHRPQPRAKCRARFDANPDLIFRIDAEGRYLDYHSANHAGLMFRPEEFLGRRIDELFDADFAATAMDAIERAIKTRTSQLWEYSLPIDGEILDFESQIVPSGDNEVISIVRDITEKKRAREQLLLTETRLNHAQSVAKIGSWERELATGTVWWSEETYRLLEFDPDEVRPAFDVFLERAHPDDRAHIVDSINHSIAACRPYISHHRLILPDGRQKTLHSRADVVTDANGNAVRLVGTIQDITDRVELEKEIIAIGERERERIGRDLHDGLGQTLTGVSLGLKAVTNRLARGETPPLDVLRELEANVKQAMSETRRVTHLLSPRMSGLRPALEELVRQFDCPDMRCSIYVTATHEIHDAEIEMHLYRIAQEAASNSAKHSKARNIELRYQCDGRSISLEVLDDGIGLPEKADAEGIGLRNMRYRAHMINGSLEIEHRPQGGTRVVCSCPCRSSAESAPTGAEIPLNPSSGSGP